MIISIDPLANTPIYTQLINQIIIGIAEGKLKKGEALPSTRQLALDSGINTMTVNKAYQELKAKGFIEIHRSEGTKVATNFPDTTEKEIFKEQIKILYAESRLLGVSKDEWKEWIKDLENEMEGLK
ncbi:MAG: GntR family transcriptional regulator [Tissierellia bacterium]|nr:GntR family transcriptional regulator [Tissierellia bacterium]